jgi:hypothetical protein
LAIVIRMMMIGKVLKVKVKQFHYRPGVAQGVPGN